VSIVAMNAVLDAVAPLSQSETLVLIVLAQYANDTGGDCWPSQMTISRKARMTENGVRNILRRLEDRGHLQVLHPQVGRRSARYQIVLDSLRSHEHGSPLRVRSHKPRSPLRETAPDRRPERRDTVDPNATTRRGEPGSPDPSDPSYKRPDQPTASVFADKTEWPPFRVYAAIAREARNSALREYRTRDEGTIADLFKQACVDQGKPWHPRIMQKACDAARVAHEKAKRGFVDVLKRPGYRAAIERNPNA
jgi:hypothetical protein